MSATTLLLPYQPTDHDADGAAPRGRLRSFHPWRRWPWRWLGREPCL